MTELATDFSTTDFHHYIPDRSVYNQPETRPSFFDILHTVETISDDSLSLNTDQLMVVDLPVFSPDASVTNIDQVVVEPLTNFVVEAAPLEPSSKQDIAASAIENGKEMTVLDIYSTENEAEIMRKLKEKGLTKAERKFYIDKQLHTMTAEHAAGVEFTTIDGILKYDGTLQMFGMDVIEMYKKTAELAGPGSREDLELQGMIEVNKGLIATNSVDYISPSYCAPRSFNFAFRKLEEHADLGGYHVRENILKYDEETIGNLEKSQEHYNDIQRHITGIASQPFTTRNEFITKPIIYNSQDPTDITHLLNSLHIDTAALAYSQQFEDLFFQRNQPLLDRYFEVIDTLADASDAKESAYYKDVKFEADTIVKAIYLESLDIADYLKGNKKVLGHLLGVNSVSSNSCVDYKPNTTPTYDFTALVAYTQTNEKRLAVTGSDCGVTKGAGIVADAYQQHILTMLQKNVPLERQLVNTTVMGIDYVANQFDFNCPACGSLISGGKGTTRCPSCGKEKPEDGCA